VIGIVSALYHHAKTGEGQHIDVSMLGALSAMQSAEPFKILEDLGIPMRTGATVPRLSPFGVFPAADGNVVICCSGDVNFRKLMAAMERTDLIDDERFATQVGRLHHYAELDEEVAAWTRTLSVNEVVARMDAAGVAGAEVRTPAQASDDPRVRARGEVVQLKHPDHDIPANVLGPGLPILFSRSKAAIPEATAKLGQHNRAIYGDLLGLSDEELARLRNDEVI
jgi:crotonobetainyl-CoA:carnitine CoA-transferase CaiB-like acyl-CoA transferase